MLFSQRKGLKPVRSLLQIDDIDVELRNGLWNALQLTVWGSESTSYNDLEDTDLQWLFTLVWHKYFKKPIDTLPYKAADAIKTVRDYFFRCEWYEVYDFVEFISGHMEKPEELINVTNSVLKRELAGYRLIDKKIVQVTSEEEVASIELALENTGKLAGTHAHLKTSLAMLADRKNPDYRNSVKEAVSAVESIAQVLSGDSSATLGSALKVLEKRSLIHPALKASLSSLYGYTSDAEGIRHAMLQEPSLTFIDAKFMLVSCTAFINYLVGKASEGGIKLS